MQQSFFSRLKVTAVALLLAPAFLTSCSRDDESQIRVHLAQWHMLGDTQYFQSGPRCTGAIFSLRSTRTLPPLKVQTDTEKAKEILRRESVAVIRMPGVSPAELTDLMLLSGDGYFGRQALAAAALAPSCFDDDASAQVRAALQRPHGMLGYELENQGLMIVDHETQRLFYIAGDVW